MGRPRHHRDSYGGRHYLPDTVAVELAAGTTLQAAIRTHPPYTLHATQSPPPIPAQILVGALMMGATVCFFSAKRAQTTVISEQKNDNAAKSRVYAAWRDRYHVSVHLFTTGANLVLSSSLLASV